MTGQAARHSAAKPNYPPLALVALRSACQTQKTMMTGVCALATIKCLLAVGGLKSLLVMSEVWV
jgi:hypothetical protein